MSLTSYAAKLIAIRKEYVLKNKVDGNGQFVHGDQERILANAKAEQCLDDLYYLHEAIKETHPTVARLIRSSMKGTYYIAIIKGPDKIKKKRTKPSQTAMRRKKVWS
jgi:hypothetical protein